MSYTVNPRGRRFEAYASAKVGKQLVRDRRSGFVSYEEAEAWAKLREAELSGESPATVGNAPVTLRTLGDLAMADLWDDISVPADYRSALRSIYEILGSDTKIWSIGQAHMDRLRTELLKTGNTPGTVNRKCRRFATLTKWAFGNGWMRTQLQVTALKEKPNRIRIPTKLEVDTMVLQLAELGQPLYARLIRLMAETGLRISEALRATPSDLTASGKQLVVISSKGGKQRVVPMTPAALRALGRDLEPFISLRAPAANRYWNICKQRIGLAGDPEFVPHCLRHGVATRLVVGGVALPVIQAIMGHSRIQTTMKYVHIDPSMYGQAGAVMAAW